MNDESFARDAAVPIIDLVGALDLLAAALDELADPLADALPPGAQAGGFTGPRGRCGCLAGRALSRAAVAGDDLRAVCERGVRDVAQQDLLPVQLTLGAVVVLDATQRRQHRGDSGTQAFDHAVGVAQRYVDLLPDAAFSSVGPAVRVQTPATERDALVAAPTP